MKNIIKHRVTDHTKGILLLVITAILWSTSGIGIKSVEWNPMALAGVRSAFAAVVIGFAFRNTRFRWNKVLVAGGVAYAIMLITFVSACKLTTVANAILLQYTCPIFVAILSICFLNEKLSIYDWITIALTSVGMLIFFQEKMTLGALIGNLLAVVSGAAMACMTICMRMQKDGSPHGVVLLGNILTFLCGLPFMFNGIPGVMEWSILAALGTMQLGLAYVLYSIAIKSVSALDTSLITMIEPIINPFWVFLFIGERASVYSLIGGGIILSTIVCRFALLSFGSCLLRFRQR